jgi:acid phosphatase family membrane protein YuiD
VTDYPLKVVVDMLSSPYLVATLAAYLAGQVAKLIFAVIKNRSFRPKQLFVSGGMPSTHTAATFALATTIGLSYGFGSAIFAVTFVFTAVVAYDAMHVRRAVGEQGEAIDKLIKNDKHPFFSRGHRPMEVLAGIVLGVLAGILVYNLF